MTSSELLDAPPGHDAARNGAESAASAEAILKELIEEHSVTMFRVAKSIVQDTSLAQDVVQESLVKAWQAASSFRGDSSLKSWALRITHNTAISTLRKRREEFRDPMMLPEVDSQQTPDRQVSGRFMVDDLWKSLETLDPLSKTIVVLREIEGMTYEEIAETLELPLPTVKTRLFRGRKLLAASLQEWR
jgi:RNA polymerase sigma-70 factor, ECF subfamily